VQLTSQAVPLTAKTNFPLILQGLHILTNPQKSIYCLYGENHNLSLKMKGQHILNTIPAESETAVNFTDSNTAYYVIERR